MTEPHPLLEEIARLKKLSPTLTPEQKERLKPELEYALKRLNKLIEERSTEE